MNESKTKKIKTKKSSVKSKKTKVKRASKSKKSKNSDFEDTGVVVVDDDLSIDKEKELEERRAFLEEARSQDSSE
jgi:choline kinase